jgi:hypothetical protein
MWIYGALMPRWSPFTQTQCGLNYNEARLVAQCCVHATTDKRSEGDKAAQANRGLGRWKPAVKTVTKGAQRGKKPGPRDLVRRQRGSTRSRLQSEELMGQR